jgi:hypothetical protein
MLRGARPRGPGWHRAAVGGMWEEVGALQFEFMVRHGLAPHHYLLDVGCGALRGGVHFIRYLEPAHYYGLEHEPATLEAGRTIELVRAGLEHKHPQLLLDDDFDLSTVPPAVRFDFMLAQSVFTHLTPAMIERCLRKVMPRLDGGGTFYATFHESRDGAVDDGKPHRWRSNERRGAKYPVGLFEDIARRIGARVAYIGEWNHPRHQKMLAFRHAPR